MCNFVSAEQLKKTLIAHSNSKAPRVIVLLEEGKSPTTPEYFLFNSRDTHLMMLLKR